MTAGPGQAHKARNPQEQKVPSACVALGKMWNWGYFVCLFVYSLECLIGARGYFRGLQSHPFDLLFALKHVCLVNYI